jgi:hypothetical protein
VIEGNHSAKARRELMQEYPRFIIYVGLTNSKEKLLAWDHNTNNEYIMSMTFIKRVIFIHNEFFEIFHGERSNVDVKFQKKCCMKI